MACYRDSFTLFIVSNDRMIGDYKFETLGKDEMVAEFRVLFQHLSRQAKSNLSQNIQSRH
jgi:hypothetical protein